MAVTFVLVVFAWIFFRADSIRDALGVIKRIVTCQTHGFLFDGEIYNLGLDRIEMNISDRQSCDPVSGGSCAISEKTDTGCIPDESESVV